MEDPNQSPETNENNGASAPQGTTPADMVDPPQPRPALRPLQINLLGFALILYAVVVAYLIYALWPSGVEHGIAQNHCIFCCSDCDHNAQSNGWLCVRFFPDQHILVLVLLSGALGSLIHAISSFSNFVGQGQLERSWVWWYALRPFIGMGLAFVFYMIFRGGLLNNTKAEALNIYGILSLSVLAGLFTDRATLKLEEIFEALFKPKDERKDKLTDSPNK